MITATVKELQNMAAYFEIFQIPRSLNFNLMPFWNRTSHANEKLYLYEHKNTGAFD